MNPLVEYLIERFAYGAGITLMVPVLMAYVWRHGGPMAALAGVWLGTLPGIYISWLATRSPRFDGLPLSEAVVGIVLFAILVSSVAFPLVVLRVERAKKADGKELLR